MHHIAQIYTYTFTNFPGMTRLPDRGVIGLTGKGKPPYTYLHNKSHILLPDRRAFTVPLFQSFRDRWSPIHIADARHSTVELSRVGGVNAPIGTHDPVYNFLCFWSIEVGDKWWYNDVIVKSYQYRSKFTYSQTAVFSFQIVDRIRQQSLWASCDCTRLRVCVGGVHWVWQTVLTATIHNVTECPHA